MFCNKKKIVFPEISDLDIISLKVWKYYTAVAMLLL